MFAGLQELPIQEVLIRPKPTCLPGPDLNACVHNLHINRGSHCFDKQLATTCKAAGREETVPAISASFQSEVDVKSVTIYNPPRPSHPLPLFSLPEPIKVVR